MKVTFITKSQLASKLKELTSIRVTGKERILVADGEFKGEGERGLPCTVADIRSRLGVVCFYFTFRLYAFYVLNELSIIFLNTPFVPLIP